MEEGGEMVGLDNLAVGRLSSIIDQQIHMVRSWIEKPSMQQRMHITGGSRVLLEFSELRIASTRLNFSVESYYYFEE